jgi:riboflavin-specific deaminase-like protein
VQPIEVSEGVWDRLLAVKQGNDCSCCGEWTVQQRAALDLYGPIARRDISPMVIGQVGQSLDGRVTAFDGDSKDVSGPDGILHLHRLRALVDAVVIGVNTALLDSPRLTVRLCKGENPARVVIDPKGRLPDESPVFLDDGARRVVIQATETKRPTGVEVVKLRAIEGQFHPAEIIEALANIGLENLLIEGGAFTIAKFIEHDLLSRLHIGISPIIIGSGKPGINLQTQQNKLEDAIRPSTRSFSLGPEVIFDCGLTTASEASITPMHG